MYVSIWTRQNILPKNKGRGDKGTRFELNVTKAGKPTEK